MDINFLMGDGCVSMQAYGERKTGSGGRGGGVLEHAETIAEARTATPVILSSVDFHCHNQELQLQEASSSGDVQAIVREGRDGNALLDVHRSRTQEQGNLVRAGYLSVRVRVIYFSASAEE